MGYDTPKPSKNKINSAADRLPPIGMSVASGGMTSYASRSRNVVFGTGTLMCTRKRFGIFGIVSVGYGPYRILRRAEDGQTTTL